MCCSRIRVTLNGVVKDKKDGFSGTYQKASGLTNNRSYWNQINGNQALWYVNTSNYWMIGHSSDLGSNGGYIYSVQETACPNSDNLFKYWNSSEFLLAPINSVSIECV